MTSAAVVIVTCRRPEVLEGGLRAWAASHRPPDQLVVVDASPDAADRAPAVLERFPALFGGGGRYLAATVPSTTIQRNAALEVVATDVVAFADDDSRPDPRYLGRLLEVFERDPDRSVGGVAGVAARPSGAAASLGRLVAPVGRRVGQRYAMPRRVARPPLAVPAGLDGLPLVRRRGLNGCNMVLRTELVRRHRFDEAMRGWAYGEDFDLTFRIGRRHLLLARTDARLDLAVAHGAGVDPGVFFMARWVNPGYLIAKHDLGPPAWRSLHRLLALHRAAGTAAAGSAGERRAVAARYRDAARALAVLRAARGADDLAARYRALQDGFSADGLGADGLGADGLGADGLSASGSGGGSPAEP